MFTYLRNYEAVFQDGAHFTFSQAVFEDSNFSTLSIFGIDVFFIALIMGLHLLCIVMENCVAIYPKTLWTSGLKIKHL